MSRLTKSGGKFVSCNIDDECTGMCGSCKRNTEIRHKLRYYEDLEEQLEKLYGGKMPLDEVVENLNRVIQNGEEKLDYARILTNAEAEKWDKWKDIEKQGRLIELSCLPDEEVWISNKRFGTHKTMYASRGAIVDTKEAAESKLAEMDGTSRNE